MPTNFHAPLLDEPIVQYLPRYLPPAPPSFEAHLTDRRRRCHNMKTDPAINRLSRNSSGMNRPVQSPMGPRTRYQRSATIPEHMDSRDSFASLGDPSPAYPSSPARSEESSLPPVMEQSPTPPPTSIPTSTSTSASASTPTPPSSSTPPPFTTTPPPFTPTPTPTPTPPPNNAKVIIKPPLLVPVHSLNFESVPIQFKALTHEAALWTFDSQELHELVSRALRRSTPNTYIRLLSLENLDNAIPAEIDRLKKCRLEKQARYRWLVQRRSMLLQALSTASGSPEKQDAEDGTSAASQLLLQLSQTLVECDKVMEELLATSDQLSQLSNLTEHHWASALAVALRKLNKSYAKRTSDLITARQKVSQLEGELEDAWKEAEKVAKEIDEIEKVALDSDDEEPIIETAEKVDLFSSRPVSRIPAELLIQSRRNTRPMVSLPVLSPLSPMPRASAIPSPDTPILHTAFASPLEKDDAGSVRSMRSSTKSMSSRSWKNSLRSTREGTRLSLVSAAKTRSHRASKSSLRIKRLPILPHPPMPELPYEFSNPVPLAAARASSLLADPEGRITPGRSRRTSFDDAMPSRKSTVSYTPTVTMDDIYVRLQNRGLDIDEIQVESRTPPPAVPFPTVRDQPSKAIPSMWLMSDSAPKAAPQPGVPLQRQTSSSKQAYKKLKILTQRYSLHFPLFKSKPSEPHSISPTTSRSAPAGIHL